MHLKLKLFDSSSSSSSLTRSHEEEAAAAAVVVAEEDDDADQVEKLETRVVEKEKGTSLSNTSSSSSSSSSGGSSGSGTATTSLVASRWPWLFWGGGDRRGMNMKVTGSGSNHNANNNNSRRYISTRSSFTTTVINHYNAINNAMSVNDSLVSVNESLVSVNESLVSVNDSVNINARQQQTPSVTPSLVQQTSSFVPLSALTTALTTTTTTHPHTHNNTAHSIHHITRHIFTALVLRFIALGTGGGQEAYAFNTSVSAPLKYKSACSYLLHFKIYLESLGPNIIPRVFEEDQDNWLTHLLQHFTDSFKEVDLTLAAKLLKKKQGAALDLSSKKPPLAPPPNMSSSVVTQSKQSSSLSSSAITPLTTTTNTTNTTTTTTTTTTNTLIPGDQADVVTSTATTSAHQAPKKNAMIVEPLELVPFLLPQPPPERIMHAENLSTMTAAQKSILKYYNKLVAQYPHIPSFDILWDYGNRSGIQSTFSTNTTTTTTAGNGEDGALNNDNNNNDSDNNMDESSPPSTSTKNNPDAQVIISSLHHFGAFLLHLHHSFSSPSLSTIRNYLSEFKRLLESKNSKIDLFRRRYDPWFKNLMVKYAGVSTASRRGMAPLNTSSSSSSSYTSATTTATTRLGKQIKEAAATKIKETGGDGDEDEDDEDIRMTGLIYDYDDDESDDDDVHYKEFTTTLHTRRHLHPLSRNPVFVVKEHWDSLTKNQQKVLSHYNRYRTTIRAETSSGNDGGGGEEDNNGQSLLPTFDELWLMAHRHGISSSSSSSTTISSSSSATSAINDTETTTSSPNIHHTIKHIYSRFAGYLYDQFLETGSPTFVGARVYLSNFRRLIQGHKSSAVVFNQDCDDGDDGGGGGGEDKGKAATAVEVMDHEKNIKEKKKGDLKEVEEEAGWVKKIRTQLKEKYGEKHVESSIRNSQEAGSIVEEYAANSVTTSRDVLKASKRLAKKQRLLDLINNTHRLQSSSIRVGIHPSPPPSEAILVKPTKPTIIYTEPTSSSSFVIPYDDAFVAKMANNDGCAYRHQYRLFSSRSRTTTSTNNSVSSTTFTINSNNSTEIIPLSSIIAETPALFSTARLDSRGNPVNHDKLHGGVRSRTQPPQQQPPPRPQPFSSSLKFVHVDELEKYTSSNGSNMQVEPDGNYDDNVVATWIGNNNGSGLEFTGDQLDYGRGEGGGGVYEHVKVDQLSSLPAKNNSSRIVTSPATRTIQEDTREKDDLDRFILESPLKRKRTTSIIKPTTDSEDDEDRNSSGEAPDAPAQESPTNQTRLQDKKKGNMVVLNNNTSSSSSHSLVVMMRSNQPLFYTPTNEDDVASYRNIFVKHTMDAMMLFQACRMGRIALVGDRLNERNRELIESGCVYIYENAPGSKIRRWVDGKSWSSSKCAGNFFIYHELSARIPPSKVAADNNGSNSSSSLFKDSQGDLVRVGSKGSFTYKAGGLIKKTMSATVDGWNLNMISYYTEDQVETEQIIPVSWQPEFEDFVVPKDLLQQQSFRTKNMYS